MIRNYRNALVAALAFSSSAFAASAETQTQTFEATVAASISISLGANGTVPMTLTRNTASAQATAVTVSSTGAYKLLAKATVPHFAQYDETAGAYVADGIVLAEDVTIAATNGSSVTLTNADQEIFAGAAPTSGESVAITVTQAAVPVLPELASTQHYRLQIIYSATTDSI